MNNKIKDATQLAKLSFLTKLNFEKNYIKDFSPFNGTTISEINGLQQTIINDTNPTASNHLLSGGTLVVENPIVVQDSKQLTFSNGCQYDANKKELSWTNLQSSGEATCSFHQSDNTANSGFSGTFKVNYTLDTLPVITSLVDSKTIELGSTPTRDDYLKMFNLKAMSAGVDITNEINVDATKVKTDVVGNYQLEVSVINSFGSTTTKTLNVEVVAKTVIAPKLKHTSNPTKFELGKTLTKGEYIKHFSVMVEDKDGNELKNVVINVDVSKVKPSVEGTYKVVFSAENDGVKDTLELEVTFEPLPYDKKGNTTYFYEKKKSAYNGKDAWFNNRTEVLKNNLKTIYYYNFASNRLKTIVQTPKNGSILNRIESLTISGGKITKKQTTYFNGNEHLTSTTILELKNNKFIKTYNRTVSYTGKIMRNDRRLKYSGNGQLKLGAYEEVISYNESGRKVRYFKRTYQGSGKYEGANEDLFANGYRIKNTFFRYSVNGDFRIDSYKKVSTFKNGLLVKAVKRTFRENGRYDAALAIDYYNRKMVKKTFFQYDGSGRFGKNAYRAVNKYNKNRKLIKSEKLIYQRLNVKKIYKYRLYRNRKIVKQFNYYYNNKGNVKGNASCIVIIFNKKGKPRKAYEGKYSKKGKLSKGKRIKITNAILEF